MTTMPSNPMPLVVHELVNMDDNKMIEYDHRCHNDSGQEELEGIFASDCPQGGLCSISMS